MDSLPVQQLKPGLVNLPGATPASAALVSTLLHDDFLTHHCYFNDLHFHNHLSHHVLSLHDLGAPPECIQSMFDRDAALQRPLLHGKADAKTGAKADAISIANWTSHMGESNAPMYADYLAFFSSEIATHGVPSTLARFVFSPEANGNGTLMLARLFGGLMHPLIFIGFGVEFGLDFLVAQGLAIAALTTPEGASVIADTPAGLPEIKAGPPTTLLALLREVYDTPALQPVPYAEGHDPRTLQLDAARSAALRAIYAKWTFPTAPDPGPAADGDADADVSSKIDECMWQAALLLGATGRPARAPRPDFFLMHVLTSAIALRPIARVLAAPRHRAQLLHAHARAAAHFVVLRGRPRIDCALVMAYPAEPAPPARAPTSASAAPAPGAGGSAWLPLLHNACAHPEPHVVKAVRVLFHCAQRLGHTRARGVPGAVDAAGAETHAGAADLDGTLFVRVAGALTQVLGWVAHGDAERFWDFSGVGWDEAWREAQAKD
ncbi:hypothetical protein GGX14DRAFT_529265 [Mycena pura]|uniref:Oxidoreductase AflY n=1 Tax=Mycena pura TaxID=153505 RepID=A0AAD6UTZ6_9AGAR|nr:hypothetical protein GGX14DRAFT_529265 [Mycena pura]